MLGSTNKTRKTYLQPISGKIVQSVGEDAKDDEKVRERVNKVGKTVYERMFDFVAGEVVDMEIHSGDYGDRIMITIVDMDNEYELQVPVESKYGQSILMRMPNIDFSNRVLFMPYEFEDDNGKKKSGFVLSQGVNADEGRYNKEEKVQPAHTRDNPNGLPELEVKTRGSKTTYDDTDRINFLLEQFEKLKPTRNEAPKIGASQKEEPSGTSKPKPRKGKTVEKAEAIKPNDDFEDDGDPLPF